MIGRTGGTNPAVTVFATSGNGYYTCTHGGWSGYLRENSMYSDSNFKDLICTFSSTEHMTQKEAEKKYYDLIHYKPFRSY